MLTKVFLWAEVSSHAKIKPYLTILTMFLMFISQTTFGQTTFELKGQLIDCADSLPLAFGHMFLKQGDSIIQTMPIDDRGEFKFKELTPGNFQLETYYFYFPSIRQEINIPNDRIINICIKEGNSDSLLASYKSQQTYTIYYFGLPSYLDEDLNTVGKQYGVKWQNFGCVRGHDFDKYNKVIEKMLAHRNGNDWKDKFWNEVKQKYGN